MRRDKANEKGREEEERETKVEEGGQEMNSKWKSENSLRKCNQMPRERTCVSEY